MSAMKTIKVSAEVYKELARRGDLTSSFDKVLRSILQDTRKGEVKHVKS